MNTWLSFDFSCHALFPVLDITRRKRLAARQLPRRKRKSQSQSHHTASNKYTSFGCCFFQECNCFFPNNLSSVHLCGFAGCHVLTVVPSVGCLKRVVAAARVDKGCNSSNSLKQPLQQAKSDASLFGPWFWGGR